MIWKKTTVFIALFLGYTAYSGWVYTFGTEQNTAPGFSAQQMLGKQLWQKNNCSACHQLYGLGGYLGPDLTTLISDKKRGKPYAAAFLKTGGTTMPDFHLSEKEIDAVISYLAYIDASVKNNDNITP
jgi:nitric oxide reductase subunit C